MSSLPPSPPSHALRAVTIVLVVAAGFTFLPLWAPLVLAAWVAMLARPLLARTAKLTRGRHRAAGALVAALIVVILVPLAVAFVSLSRGAADLGRNLLESKGVKSALIAVVSGAQPTPEGTLGALASPEKILELLQEHGAQAWQLVSNLAGLATEALLGAFIFVYAVYVFLVDGAPYYDWMERHAPLEVAHTRRFADAFSETGRGLFVSVGLTGLAQGGVATIAYFSLGVPRALVLGLLTCVASLLPSIGTALIWVPVAIGLALTGKVIPAVVLAVVGVFVIGTIDNVLRPVFARFGKLNLSSFVLLTSIFGGLAMFGTWGLFLGPLFARLAKEALMIVRKDPEDLPKAAPTAATP